MAEPDLLSLVLTLRPAFAAGTPTPNWWGRAAHALLLRAIAASDPALAASLHEDNQARPFTASSLIGKTLKGRAEAQFEYSLRFTSLRADLSGILLQAAQPGGVLAPGAQVELDELAFEVLSAAASPEEQPWAGQTSYADLAARQLVSTEAPARQMSLLFASPTAFKSQERTQPLPLPELVFGSLLERWNAFAPLTFPSEAKRYAAECLAVSRFDIQSRAVPAKNGGLVIGGVGQVSYTTLNYDRYWMSLMHTLAAFARFAGVGARTAQGMGQCRQVE